MKLLGLLGSFKTLNEAEKLREKAMKKGQKDAFVIIFINGERFYLGQLLNMGIFKLD